MGMVDPSRIISGSVPNTEMQDRQALNKTMARPPQVISSSVLLTLSFLKKKKKKIIKNLIFGIKSFLIPHNIHSKIIKRVKKKTTVVFFTVMYLKIYIYFRGFPGSSVVKTIRLPMQETHVQCLVQEDPRATEQLGPETTTTEPLL